MCYGIPHREGTDRKPEGDILQQSLQIIPIVIRDRISCQQGTKAVRIQDSQARQHHSKRNWLQTPALLQLLPSYQASADYFQPSPAAPTHYRFAAENSRIVSLTSQQRACIANTSNSPATGSPEFIDQCSHWEEERSWAVLQNRRC